MCGLLGGKRVYGECEAEKYGTEREPDGIGFEMGTSDVYVKLWKILEPGVWSVLLPKLCETSELAAHPTSKVQTPEEEDAIGDSSFFLLCPCDLMFE